MRRRGWSAGTIAMIVFTAVVLCCTAAVIVTIRGGSENLSVDAERLSGTISALVDYLQPTDEPAPVTVSAIHTPEPAVNAATPAPVTAAPMQTARQTAAQPANVRHTLSITLSGVLSPSMRLYYGAFSSGKYNAGLIFSGIAEALHADMNIVPLDISVIEKDTDWWTQAMKSAGFDSAVPLRERAGEARQDVLNTLSANGMTALGASEKDGFTLHTVNGVHLAVFVCAEDAGQAGGWISVYDPQRMADGIRNARALGAEAVLVFIHWKKSAAGELTDAQRAIAQALCDAGTDIMIGVRSAMVWPVEYVTGPATGRKMLAAWSMGTLVSDNRETREAVSGLLLHIDLSCDTATREIAFTRVTYTPCYAWAQQEDGVYRYRVIQSAKDAPASMNERQREIMARALKLIQDAMSRGIALQR